MKVILGIYLNYSTIDRKAWGCLWSFWEHNHLKQEGLSVIESELGTKLSQPFNNAFKCYQNNSTIIKVIDLSSHPIILLLKITRSVL